MAQKQPFLERVRKTGRGAFRQPMKGDPRGPLEEAEERMQA